MRRVLLAKLAPHAAPPHPAEWDGVVVGEGVVDPERAGFDFCIAWRAQVRLRVWIRARPKSDRAASAMASSAFLTT